MAASGGRTAARSSASATLSAASDVEVRLPQDDLEGAHDLRLVVAHEDPPAPRLDAHGPAPATPRPDLPRPAPAAARRRTSCPGQGGTRPRCGRRWPPRSRARSPGRGPSPSAPSRESPRWKGSKTRSSCSDGIPGRGPRPGPRQAAAHLPRPHRHRLAARVAVRVLDHVEEGALELGGVGPDQRHVAVDPEPEAVLAARLDDGGCATSSSIEHQSRRGAAEPASSRERSIRFSTSRVSRCPSSVTASASTARSSSPSAGEASASPAATIAVRGVRRSWETERSSAVFSSSLRRSARASTASASSARRCSSAATSSSSASRASRPRCSASAARERATLRDQLPR